MLSESKRQTLKTIAYHSINYGLHYGQPIPVELSQLSSSLTHQRATFVTLNKFGQLRGCMGTLEATRPLAKDVATNSYSAAFKDPRFPSITAEELNDIDIHISILSPVQEIAIQSEDDLIAQLRPGIDGLILDDGIHRATFLPSVWESLPDPASFLQQLKRKAGLPAHNWPEELRAFRYTTECI